MIIGIARVLFFEDILQEIQDLAGMFTALSFKDMTEFRATEDPYYEGSSQAFDRARRYILVVRDYAIKYRKEEGVMEIILDSLMSVTESMAETVKQPIRKRRIERGVPHALGFRDAMGAASNATLDTHERILDWFEKGLIEI